MHIVNGNFGGAISASLSQKVSLRCSTILTRARRDVEVRDLMGLSFVKQKYWPAAVGVALVAARNPAHAATCTETRSCAVMSAGTPDGVAQPLRLSAAPNIFSN
ncbi:MAG: hypothetical protein ABI627_19145 [Polyangiaceae bacterium]